MPRVTIAEAERDFVNLVERVHAEGISVDVARGDEILARLVPGGPRSPLPIQNLNTFLQSLPKLGDDAADFSEALRAARSDFPAEANPWD
jgi:antitoxin (DNA-binding transcriptional repressor) of toxin-antitoxin stability system